jgi:hypothetical protein
MTGSNVDLYFGIIYIPAATALEVKGHQAEKAIFTYRGFKPLTRYQALLLDKTSFGMLTCRRFSELVARQF